MDQKERWRLLYIGLATLVLLVGSFLVFNFIQRAEIERKNREVSQSLNEIVAQINNEVDFATNLLYGLRGLVTSGEVNAERWKDYIASTDLENRYPGLYSLAYVERVDRRDLGSFIKSIKTENGPAYANYSVFPLTGSTELFPIKFLHSVNPEISTLLGFDFKFSDKTTEAFTEAVISDGPKISQLAYLNLIIPGSSQTGYEIVLPVYSKPNIKDFPLEERKRYLIGFVGMWVDPSMVKFKNVDMTGVRFSIFDDGFMVVRRGEIDENNLKISEDREIQVLNRTLVVRLESDRRFELKNLNDQLPFITLSVIGLILLMWTLTIYSTLTARKQAIDMAEMATKDLKKFKQAVDGVSDHVIITDPEGVVTYANKAATQITGYENEEIVGKRPSLWGGQMPKEFYKKFWQTIKYDKQPFWGEIVNKRKNGELYDSEVHVSPILDKNDNLLFFVGIEKDLSRFRAIEKMKTEFISLASHQLRTPLSAVKWFSEMLLGGDAGKLTRLQEKYLSKISESNEREIQLVNALLNVSRIESGKIVVLPKPTNLKELVENVLSEAKVNLEGNKKVLQYSIDKNVPNVMVDSDLIKHVYSNLISNAVKYTAVGGKITIKIFLRGNNVISEVKDDGIGIPKEEQRRIFEKFFRASNALKKETDGSGLGLYLTKTIVESSGGKVWFTSGEGKGSVFTFSLPIRAIRPRGK